jgi:hypothetical protein
MSTDEISRVVIGLPFKTALGPNRFKSKCVPNLRSIMVIHKENSIIILFTKPGKQIGKTPYLIKKNPLTHINRNSKNKGKKKEKKKHHTDCQI